MERCFYFINPNEDQHEVINDLLNFLDGSEWKTFVSSLSSTDCNSKIQISSIMQKILSGTYSPERIFTSYDHVALVNSFIVDTNPDFFKIAITLYSQKKTCVVPFLDTLLYEHPLIVSKVLPIFTNTKLYDTFANLVILTYHRSKTPQLYNLVTQIPIPVLIPQMYNIVNTIQSPDSDVFVSILLDLPKTNQLIHQIHVQIKFSIEFHEPNFINVILDYLQKGSTQNQFSYSNVFNSIFGNSTSNFLASILLSRAPRTPKTVVQVQAELIDKSVSLPLKKFLQKENSSGGLMTEEEILSLANEFVQKKAIPTSITTLNLFNQKFLTTTFANMLRNLALSNYNANLLLEELEKKKILHRNIREQIPNKTNLSHLEQIVDLINDNNVDQMAPQLFNQFHISLYREHTDNIPEYMSYIQNKIISKISFSTIDKLSQIIINFLCSNLSEQHRKSLSILALRCPISRYVQRIFECDLKREIDILIGLHEAALQSSNYLQINQTLKKQNSLTTVKSSQEISSEIITFDRKILLRFRWRTLRGDTNSEISFFPEFIQLSESDPVLFLNWETKVDEPTGQQRITILSKLGIVTNFELFPKLIFELISQEYVSPSITEILIPLFSNVDQKKIIIPEKSNFEILFNFSFIWCGAVLNNPRVVQILRDPPLFVSQSLLNHLPQSETDCNQLFELFPHGFMSILYNFDELSGEIPSIFHVSNSIVNENFDNVTFNDTPRFAIISIVYVMIKRGKNIILIPNVTDSKEWITFCFFFSICFHHFEESTTLLRNFPFLFPFLCQNVKEEIFFVGARKWADSLIEYAIYCARSEIFFEQSESWKRFLASVKIAEWPGELSFNQQNLCCFQNYERRCFNEIYM